jgi:aspartyl protease family protein
MMSQQSSQRTVASQRRLGGWMIAAAWVLVIALVSLLFGDVLDRWHNPNRQVQSVRTDAEQVQVRLLQNRAGHYVATGSINQEPVVFLLDTGATDLSVPAALARRLGLEAGPPMRAQTANGVVTTYLTRIDRVRLGDIVMHDVRAHINPGMNTEEVLLGMSFLRELDLTQRDGVLTLTQRSRR